MGNKLLLHLLIGILCNEALCSEQDNPIETHDDDNGHTLSVDDLKNETLNEENLKDLGEALSNFMQSDGVKQIGNILMNSLQNGGDNVIMNQLLQGLSSMVQQQQPAAPKTGESGDQPGLSPELFGNLLNLMLQAKSGDNTDGGGMDFAAILQLLAQISVQHSSGYMNLLPNSFNILTQSFSGPEAEKRESKHQEHAGMFPPNVERLHVLVDHFINSDMGAAVREMTGAKKGMKMFADEHGNFSYSKFVEMFENHSFRKHWIKIITKEVASFVSYFADPYKRKQFLSTYALFLNGFLKNQGVPKTAHFNPMLPKKSFITVVNFFSKKYLGEKVDSKTYIRPTLKYFEELLAIAQQKGIAAAEVDSNELSHKIADTINLEIIEPVVRVNRAYRFALRVPKCDRYVLCLVNQIQPDEVQSIPGMKLSLSTIASILASWFISDLGHTSFSSLYTMIVEENNCQAMYLDECQQFSIEEIKVTKKYVHQEL